MDQHNEQVVAVAVATAEHLVVLAVLVAVLVVQLDLMELVVRLLLIQAVAEEVALVLEEMVEMVGLE